MEDIKRRRHIASCDPHVSFCTGCGSCEIMCSLLHEGSVSPKTRRIFLKRDDTMLRHELYTCQNCVDAACYEACPLQDEAMCYDPDLQVYYVNQDSCIGCGLCVKACPFNPPRIQLSSKRKGKAIKCDLCRERPEGPACIEFCQSMVLGWSGEQVPTAEEGATYE